jgi:CheY-like chemotaxis protein
MEGAMRTMSEAGDARAAESSSVGGARILVVDDDSVDRQAVRRALRGTGFAAEVLEADGVLAAIALLTAGPLDCVILDYNLPDGDGLTFLRGMRAAGVEVPVVILTGAEEPHLAAELTTAGAADFLPKALLSPERLTVGLRKAGLID